MGRRPSGQAARATISRWPGEGTFLIEDVRLLDEMGLSQAIFEAGSPLAITIRARMSESGRFTVRPAATIYRVDGVLATNLVGEAFDVDAVEGGSVDFRLEYGPAESRQRPLHDLGRALPDALACRALRGI